MIKNIQNTYQIELDMDNTSFMNDRMEMISTINAILLDTITCTSNCIFNETAEENVNARYFVNTDDCDLANPLQTYINIQDILVGIFSYDLSISSNELTTPMDSSVTYESTESQFINRQQQNCNSNTIENKQAIITGIDSLDNLGTKCKHLKIIFLI